MTSLLGLPKAVLEDIASQVAEFDRGDSLARTCFAFYEASLLHAPAFRVQLERQRCDQLFTPRVIAALRARTRSLKLVLEQTHGSRLDTQLLNTVLDKLGNCAAVKTCKLSSSRAGSRESPNVLHCTPCLAQLLLDSFPGLTALSLHGYTVTCSGLASLLAQHLQQLDLTNTTVTQPQQPGPGDLTLDNLFHGARLKHLTLVVSEDEPLLPNLQHLRQHLTQLCLTHQSHLPLAAITSRLSPLAQLQELTICKLYSLQGVPELLQTLPQLHTLQLPEGCVWKQQQLDALLSATQLTSVQLASIKLTSPHTQAPCSWQRLELVDSMGYGTVEHLPLHSLTQPLVLGRLCISVSDASRPEAAAALHRLAHACKVPVIVKSLELDMYNCQEAEAAEQAAAAGPSGSDLDTCVVQAQQGRNLDQLVALLRPLQHSFVGKVTISYLFGGSEADVIALAPVWRGCTHITFMHGSISPSPEFWRRLVQLMPALTHVTFNGTRGAASVAMHEALQCMAEQPWARWLDITIIHSTGDSSGNLPTCWQTVSWSKTGKFRVCMK